MCVAPSSPEVPNDLLGLLGANGRAVVSIPRGHVLDLIPVGHLVISSNQAYRCGVMYRNTFMGE